MALPRFMVGRQTLRPEKKCRPERGMKDIHCQGATKNVPEGTAWFLPPGPKIAAFSVSQRKHQSVRDPRNKRPRDQTRCPAWLRFEWLYFELLNLGRIEPDGLKTDRAA